MPPRIPDAERAEHFWSKVDKSDSEGCWLWTGSRNAKGYGHYCIRRSRTRYAHRFAYSLTYGPVSSRIMVCHKCDNPPCVRPDHLFLGTNSDNIQDSLKKGRFPVGDASPQSRITDDQVAAIRLLDDIRLGIPSQEKRLLAIAVGISLGHLNDLLVGRKRRATTK